jgi:glutathione S-transferase
MATEGLPVLTYFRIRGKAETIRLMFAYKNKPLTDKYISTSSEWKSAVKPYGQVPVMQLENSQFLSQSKAILFYYAREFGMLSKDNFEAAKQEELCEAAFDVQAEYSKYYSAEDAKGRQAVLDGLMGKVDRWLKTWETTIQNREFFIGENYSVADIQIFRVLADLVDYIGQEPSEMFQKFPGLLRFYNQLSNQEGIKAYLTSERRFPVVKTEAAYDAMKKGFGQIMAA